MLCYRRPVHLMPLLLGAVAVLQLAQLVQLAGAAGPGIGPHKMTDMLGCNRRKYTFKVTQSDRMGRSCWDEVQVWSCWGRCDSNEISDWRFPFKRSHHPVCMHDLRELQVTTLRFCDPDVEVGTERYEFLSARACKCTVCKSSEASCEGMRFRGKPGQHGPPAVQELTSMEMLATGMDEFEQRNEV